MWKTRLCCALHLINSRKELKCEHHPLIKPHTADWHAFWKHHHVRIKERSTGLWTYIAKYIHRKYQIIIRFFTPLYYSCLLWDYMRILHYYQISWILVTLETHVLAWLLKKSPATYITECRLLGCDAVSLFCHPDDGGDMFLRNRFVQEPHGVKSQKAAFFIVSAVKTSDLT
jgi:hypothetical protein